MYRASFRPRIIVIWVKLSVTWNANTKFLFILQFRQYASWRPGRIHGIEKHSRVSVRHVSWFVVKHSIPTKTQSHWLKREFLYWNIPDCSSFFQVLILQLSPRKSYRKRVGKRGVQLKFSNAGKIVNERVVFLVLTVNKDTQKTSDKHWIYPLGKTTVKAYENDVLNGSFLMQENC